VPTTHEGEPDQRRHLERPDFFSYVWLLARWLVVSVHRPARSWKNPGVGGEASYLLLSDSNGFGFVVFRHAQAYSGSTGANAGGFSRKEGREGSTRANAIAKAHGGLPGVPRLTSRGYWEWGVFSLALRTFRCRFRAGVTGSCRGEVAWAAPIKPGPRSRLCAKASDPRGTKLIGVALAVALLGGG